MKNNNKILYISIAILVLAIGIALGTYAYYQTTISGTISGNVAKWSFTANGETSSLNLDLGDLYPGVSGTYNIELSAENSELDVYYELYIEELNTRGTLFWDANYSIGLYSYNSSLHGMARGIYGTIPAGSKISIPIYLNWPYGDSAESYSSASYFCDFRIIAQQLTGYTGSTPMYLLPDYNSDYEYSNGFILFTGK
ncbi:MAG: hypothetical protein IJB71_04555 [Bacilli bacterium]|nr:hypothetical protein [Bacilli bacterium]